jgi:hypothetical protein
VASMRVLHYASQRPPAIKRGPTQHPTRHWLACAGSRRQHSCTAGGKCHLWATAEGFD